MRRITSNILFLLFLSSFQLGAQVVPLPELINPDSITVDNHHIYITDRENIYIFSVVDFKLKTKFGKAGEGPKEFKINPTAVVNLLVDIQNTIIVNSNNRVTFFTKDGKYLKEVQISSGSDFKQIGDNYVGYSISRETKNEFMVLDLKGNVQKKIYLPFMDKKTFKTPCKC